MYHLCGFLSLGRTEERQLVESERGLWVGQEQPVLGMLHKKSVQDSLGHMRGEEAWCLDPQTV